MANRTQKSTKLVVLLIINAVLLISFSCSRNQKKEISSQQIKTLDNDSLKAITLYEKSLILYNQFGEPVFKKDSLDLRQAILYMDSALQYMPNNRNYLHFRADIYLKLGMLEEALSEYKNEYLTFDSTTNYFSFELGLLSYYLKEPDYLRYFENGLRVFKKKMDSNKLDRLQEFEYESRYIYSMFFIDSTESIKEYIAFRDKNYKKASYMYNFDLRECSKLDLVGYFIFHDTFNNTPPNRKRHQTE